MENKIAYEIKENEPGVNQITFIIPSVGRETLINSLASLINQTVKEWNAIVMFDGIEPTITMTDPRIKFLRCPKLGEGFNSAGNVRNEAIKHAETKWIAFLDDDDYLSPRYVETFLDETQNFPFLDLIIFRMYKEQNGENNEIIRQILPDLNVRELTMGSVGISFLVKTELFHKGDVTFKPSHIEDFVLLCDIFSKGYKAIISPYVRYFVGKKNVRSIRDFSEFTENATIGMRVFFNA